MILHYLPIISGIICVALMITARLLTNRHIKNYRARIAHEAFYKMKSAEGSEQKQKHLLEAADTIGKSPRAGEFPAMFSAIYVLGFIGLVITFFWTLISIGWLEGVIVASLYLCSGCVTSVFSKTRK